MRIFRWIGVAVAALAVILAAVYLFDIRRAYDRIEGKSSMVSSPYGDIEYSSGGTGTDALVIHGSGGGYDQGELLVRAVLGNTFHWVAPSRFGYLRSTFHEGATFDDQAHAYAHLLDHLKIRKVAVVALSHGGPSALLFAVLHPDRVSSLTLVSCGVASSQEAEQDQANRKGTALMTIFKYDALYWGISRLFKKQLMGLMGASDEVVAGLTPEQRKLVDDVIDYMNPVSPRSAGAAFDNKAAMPNERIAAIRSPTLVFHAKDDSLQLYRNAEFAASRIPGAKLVSFEKGGHLLMAVERSAIRTMTQNHIVSSPGR
jgi:2-hydroxy-6-oxonona-2,4-dienedioate hydrolase